MRKIKTSTIIFLVGFVILIVFITYFLQLELLYINRNLTSEKINVNDSIINKILTKNTTTNYVFIDLDANKGDSIYHFFGIKNKEFNPYGKFPKLIDINLVNRVNWIVYAFEANPIFNENLNEMKNNLPKQHKLHLHNSTAAWIYDGTIEFYLDLVNENKNFWGSRYNQ